MNTEFQNVFIFKEEYNMAIKYSDLLFRSSKEPVRTCPGLTVGNAIPLATAVLSSKRPAAAVRTGPKIS